ncbi:MAG: CinA family nicotinamide mononucleotide deamidase-related protein, partial [Bacteroidales bacterium]|nr:CinA family nicotinamide mononucleotide deamidase-related protein [Bacteroidales bacterium]
DTNSAWIGERMSMIGIPVKRIISISDNPDEIRAALTESLVRADVVLITGGLGPTNDDKTKQTLAGYFNSVLVEDQSVLDHICQLYSIRGVTLSAINRAQALVPDKCRVITNPQGSAPGMWFEKEGKVVISMPGVPYEMISIMETSALSMLADHFKTPAILHKTIMTTGVAESKLADLLVDWEKSIPENFSLAYLPAPGTVKLRISGTGDDLAALRQRMAELTETLVSVVKDCHFGFDDVTLEEVVGTMLSDRHLTVSTAESCTGGNIARLITRIPGSSSYFKGSIVAYANEIKSKYLDVAELMLEQHGAVSKPVVEQMAKSCRLSLGTDFSITTSGIAGPEGGTPDKPVGTVWIAVAGPNGVVSQCLHLGEHRERNIVRSTSAALNLLRVELLKETTSE